MCASYFGLSSLYGRLSIAQVQISEQTAIGKNIVVKNTYFLEQLIN